ncbi:uncharacterized protein AB675_2344 [Cyphellophora attinorum]|uniref:Uncharacterized protein n=1 Tax=Cyphellophora attinorum TaxID=1664694 RepID=A0A0N1HGQ3_9EURO|nr:uncharacterized protein AB675_2344 [Phialophora attinorum]KPI44924.1 hypothetical protein AB675_2344 [Phialophora attinorum]
MLPASRAMKPKLSLSINTAAAASSPAKARPSLSIKAPLRSPISPSPISPTARNTRLNQRGYSTMQQPTYAYSNQSSARSILKKDRSVVSATRRQLSFDDNPRVHAVSPITEDGYYEAYGKVSREERRWQRR